MNCGVQIIEVSFSNKGKAAEQTRELQNFPCRFMQCNYDHMKESFRQFTVNKEVRVNTSVNIFQVFLQLDKSNPFRMKKK